MNYWSADTHFDHSNIIRYCNRPFANSDQMNQVILDNINSIIQENDIYYHLGDFAWRRPEWFVDQIRCKDIRVIIGNHDRRSTLGKLAAIGKIKLLFGYFDAKIEGQHIVMCHFPMRSWNIKSHGAWHLYGHVHGTITNPDYNSMDVGVDPNNFKPVSWAQITEHMAKFEESKLNLDSSRNLSL